MATPDTKVLYSDCKKAFLDAMSYIPPTPSVTTPPVKLTAQEQIDGAKKSREQTLEEISNIFAQNMVIAFQDFFNTQLINYLPPIKFDLKDHTKKSITGNIEYISTIKSS